MATVKELIKLAESRLDDASKDVNVAKSAVFITLLINNRMSYI